MRVICAQNDVGLEAQGRPDHRRLDARRRAGQRPVARPAARATARRSCPRRSSTDYEKIQKADPTRPVLLNLGQGVAWDDYIGRGVRSNHPEDYPEYVKGCDIASFDIYPALPRAPRRGRQALVRGRRRQPAAQVVGRPQARLELHRMHAHPTRDAGDAGAGAGGGVDVADRGSRGLIYFVHQFKPKFIEVASARGHRDARGRHDVEPGDPRFRGSPQRADHPIGTACESPRRAGRGSDRVHAQARRSAEHPPLRDQHASECPCEAAFEIAGGRTGTAPRAVRGDDRVIPVRAVPIRGRVRALRLCTSTSSNDSLY